VPQNYDRGYKGHVSLRQALASSLNVPAVRTLAVVGYEPFYRQLKALGLSLTRDAEHYGYSLALGGAEVTLLQLTNAIGHSQTMAVNPGKNIAGGTQ
jgi:penicillin-binding protein 1C